MMAYALGRSLEFSDEEEVQRLAVRSQEEGYRLDQLIEAGNPFCKGTGCHAEIKQQKQTG